MAGTLPILARELYIWEKGKMMSKLCVGTFLKSIIRCKIKSKTVTQKNIVGDIMHIIDPEFDETDDSMISNIVSGKKNPSNYVMDNVNTLSSDGYGEFIEGFENIMKYLDPNRIDELKLLICYIIENDDEIKKDTVVDLIKKNTKVNIRNSGTQLAEFLAGVFIYVLKYTDNRDSNRYVKEIDKISVDILKDNLVKDDDSKLTKELKEEISEEEDEDVLLEAQRFCVKYEDEIDLLPLCQIAYNVDLTHKNVRQMYTDYVLSPTKVKKKILQLKGIPVLDFSNKKWIDDCITKYNKQIHEDGLTTKEFLYEGAKYFHRAYERYSDCQIVDFDPRIFDRPFMGGMTQTFLKDNLTYLSFYIIDYYWYKKEEPEHYVEPPMDYLWNLCDLGGCPEPEMTYWVCKFIITSSFQMVEDGYPVDEKWENVCIRHELIRTQEDMYYYALLQLYWLYMVERTTEM